MNKKILIGIGILVVGIALIGGVIYFLSFQKLDPFNPSDEMKNCETDSDCVMAGAVGKGPNYGNLGCGCINKEYENRFSECEVWMRSHCSNYCKCVNNRCELERWDIISDFNYELGDCLEEKRGGRVDVIAKDSSVVFDQILNTYCNAKGNLKIIAERHGNVINIKEIFDAEEIARCVCSFPIHGEINLAEGNYTLRSTFENKPLGRTEVLEEVEVEL